MISGGSAPIRLYTPAELAEFFGISERTLLDWRRENGWPSVRVGRTVRFTQAQVDEILDRHSQVPQDGQTTVEPVVIPGQSKGSAARQQRAAS